MTGAAPGFDGRAARYDEQRPADDNWWEVYARLVELTSPRGQRLLELGCGTGRLAEALAEREAARVFAVDASAAMVERARARGVNARVARAEALPFKPGWFDVVVSRMAVHLFERRRAFAEAARVLGPQGRIAVASEDPESFDDVWFARYFPSVPEIDRQRFPSATALAGELEAAGFGAASITNLRQRRRLGRAEALDLIETRAYSTFELLPEAEYREGVQRARRDLPEQFEYEFVWLLAAAAR